ncbi:hypothetical protein [Microbacterium candidum]|uniref:Lipoprotein n=1 Tax=Microbacterium candidum TaxID=3041922 RepID=A0ABT7MX90_9MICO|nr:hypothetical protein [Microbacterium sp. ASV49]MDL9979071.1 hypothetical protein [Microbacterium sp. ASV49]
MMLVPFLALGLTSCGPYVGASPSKGLDVDLQTSTCSVEPSSGDALVQFEVRGRDVLGWDPLIVGYKLQDAPHVMITGDDLLGSGAAPFTTKAPPGDKVLEAMTKNVDKVWLGSKVPRDRPSRVVLLLRGRPGDVDSGSRLRIFWGGGEPVYYQDLDLAKILTC